MPTLHQIILEGITFEGQNASTLLELKALAQQKAQPSYEQLFLSLITCEYQKHMRQHLWELNAVDHQGYLPFPLAAQTGNTAALVALILLAPEHINQTSHGLSALHIAVQNNHQAMIKALLVSDHLDVTKKTADTQDTALHLAVRTHDTNTVKILLDSHDWDVFEKNKAGKSAIQLADTLRQQSLSRITNALLQPLISHALPHSAAPAFTPIYYANGLMVPQNYIPNVGINGPLLRTLSTPCTPGTPQRHPHFLAN